MPMLDWLGKAEALKAAQQVRTRLLEPVPELGAGDPASPNLLIQGDNLEALKALLPIYAGQVKCIFIDPPYNTGSAFEHYDDNLEHSTWLSLMYPRLELLRELLREDGSIWVTIDDKEGHYLKILMDEVFGRKTFVANIAWQKRTSRENRAAIGSSFDHMLLYSPLGSVKWKESRNKLPANSKGYANPDNDPKGKWRSIPFSAQGFRENQMYSITTPTGKRLKPPKGRCWGATEPVFYEYIRINRVYFPKNGNGRPRIKSYLGEEEGLVPMTWWDAKNFGDNETSKKEILTLFPDDEIPFATPKPEELMRGILHIATNPSDLVLDSFLGSGTTAAVAHKMGRRYIGIEMGEHAQTHCAPRLKKVIEGEQGGVSEAVGWKGGGGFRFLRLGDPLFEATGLINSSVTFRQLASFVWFSETRTPLASAPSSPRLGVHEGVAIDLLYNGILGDRRPTGGNVLTSKVLAALPPHEGPRLIFGEASRLGADRLRELGITFKQTPFDLKVR